MSSVYYNYRLADSWPCKLTFHYEPLGVWSDYDYEYSITLDECVEALEQCSDFDTFKDDFVNWYCEDYESLEEGSEDKMRCDAVLKSKNFNELLHASDPNNMIYFLFNGDGEFGDTLNDYLLNKFYDDAEEQCDNENGSDRNWW